MLNRTPKLFSIQPLVDQINAIEPSPRILLNEPTGSFFGDPWRVKDEFKNTPIGNVLEELHPIGEARLLRLESGETYTAHADPDDRYHLALTTNPFCYLVNFDDQQLYHLPVDGQLWHMDTGKLHVAANFGGTDRVHLNIRLLLPAFDKNKKGLKITFAGGGVDWKQDSYLDILPFLNKKIKTGEITGFEKLNSNEILVNVNNSELFSPIVDLLTLKNFNVLIEQIN
jgi:hypothetical protein